MLSLLITQETFNIHNQRVPMQNIYALECMLATPQIPLWNRQILQLFKTRSLFVYTRVAAQIHIANQCRQRRARQNIHKRRYKCILNQ
jgi:hypothetical protein